MTTSTKRPRRAVDARIEYHGSLYLLRPLSDAAREWIEQNAEDSAQRFGLALVVEHRYVGDVLEGMRADGLVAQ